PPQGAGCFRDHRPRGWPLRRLLQHLFVRNRVETERPATRRAGPHRQDRQLRADGAVHTPMRSLQRPNRIRVGLMFVAITALVIGVGQSFTSVPMLFARPSYYAQFSDSGGVHPGDKVRIAGTDVGFVEDVAIDGDHIVIKFSIDTNTIGTQSRLMIRTDTILGKKVLEVEPRGDQPLRPGETLPMGQSTTPYEIYNAVFDVTKAAAGWNIDTVKRSLNVLSETVDQTYPQLSAALDGVAKFSDSIGKRDEQIT